MPKVKFYHGRTLLWTYLVWTPLNLWVAHACCRATADPVVEGYWARVLYAWALLHILPAWGLVGVVGLPFIITGLLIKERWTSPLIIVGMSLWFLSAWCLLGLNV